MLVLKYMEVGQKGIIKVICDWSKGTYTRLSKSLQHQIVLSNYATAIWYIYYNSWNLHGYYSLVYVKVTEIITE